MKIKHIVGIVVISILVIFFIVADCILFEPTIATAMTGILCPSDPLPVLEEDEEEEGGGQAVSRRIVEEGSVLVRNENNTLPLSFATTRKVNVFGRAASDWLYSGSGSGQVQDEKDGKGNIDLLAALKNYGVAYNETLIAKYREWLSPQGYGSSLGTSDPNAYCRIADPAMSDTSVYSDDVLTEAKAFSNTALVVIGRRAGESIDCTKTQNKHKVSPGMEQTDTSRHYLEISVEEEQLLTYVGANYENVIVLINSLNVMELGFLETIPGLDSCLIVGGTGTRGAMGIPSLLYGQVSPSGKLADTYAYAMEDHANYNLVGYDGMVFYADGNGLYPYNVSLNSWPMRPSGPYYSDYSEGIYVGYRWFETADAEGVWASRTRGSKTGYSAVVQYPFGYGLSYSASTWAIQSATPANNSTITLDTEIEITVRVTNTSENATARDVVELYSTPEYHRGEIEKASVNLVGYEKTDEIEVGQYMDVVFKLKGSDLVSYDCYDKNGNGHKGYELDRGTVTLSARSDSHTVKGGSVTYRVTETQNMDEDPVTGNKVQNRFTGTDALDGISVDGLGDEGGNQEIAYMSRASFPSGALARAAARNMPQSCKDTVLFTADMERAWNAAETDVYGKPVDRTPVTFGVNSGLSVYENGSITPLGEKLGNPENYGCEEWTKLLDQLDRNEAMNMIGIGATGTPAVASVGKPVLSDRDGPVQAGGFYNPTRRGIGFPSAFVLAQSWNKQLGYEFGSAFGVSMKDTVGLNGIFGPGCNIHRSPFGGRNFEYYSEDPFISGKTVAAAVRGLKSQGRYAFVKHFALAETETGRESYYSWISEQALREIYLEPFRKAVVEGGAVGIMTAYNRVGAYWAGGSVALQDAVLRGEWGFRGAVITDYSDHNQYMNMNQSIRTGGDLGMACRLSSVTESNPRYDRELREAVKNVLYMWLNSEWTAKNTNEDYVSTNGLSESWVWWVPTLIDLQLIVYATCAVWAYFIVTGILKDRKKKKEAAAEAEADASNAENAAAIAAMLAEVSSAQPDADDPVYASLRSEEPIAEEQAELIAEAEIVAEPVGEAAPAETAEATPAEEQVKEQAQPAETAEATLAEEQVEEQAQPAETAEATPAEEQVEEQAQPAEITEATPAEEQVEEQAQPAETAEATPAEEQVEKQAKPAAKKQTKPAKKKKPTLREEVMRLKQEVSEIKEDRQTASAKKESASRKSTAKRAGSAKKGGKK